MSMLSAAMLAPVKIQSKNVAREDAPLHPQMPGDMLQMLQCPLRLSRLFQHSQGSPLMSGDWRS